MWKIIGYGIAALFALFIAGVIAVVAFGGDGGKKFNCLDNSKHNDCSAHGGFKNDTAAKNDKDAPPSNGGGAPNPAKSAPAAPTDSSPMGCHVINDYQLELLPEVASSGSYIHVEYWWNGSGGERDTLIPTSAADGGRFILTRALKGHVWELDGCSDKEAREQVDANIARRLAGHADNKGYVEWKSTGLFRPSQQR